MTIDDGLRKIMHDGIPHWHWQTIETGGVAMGVPDSNFCAPPVISADGTSTDSAGDEGWVEHKATSKWSVTLEPKQVGWIARRVRTGGRVWIAVRRRHDGGPRKGPAVDELWLIPGRLCREAKVGGLRDPLVQHAAYVWQGGPGAWDWRAVASALRQRG